MNDDTIQDLKQFITATVAQQTSEIRSEIRSDISALDKKLSAKIDDLSQSVAEALEVGGEATESKLQDHETRITRLEQKAA